MILLCGIPSEPPLAMVAEALAALGKQYVVFNQRRFAGARLEFSVEGGQVWGCLTYEGRDYALEEIDGVYMRLMDDRLLPELRDLEPRSRLRTQCRSLHDALSRWTEIAPARVVNRAGAMASNSSKPFQAQLIRRYGFEIPETLITNDPDLALEFRERHRRVIYKSISGVRSIVQTFEDRDVERLQALRWCPVQFQEFVEGDNVRVHVIGESVFPTLVVSEATDYRYAGQQVGQAAELRTAELKDEVAEKCVQLAQGLGLAFAGIDLKVTADGHVFCFEVNPSPGFSYYEANTGQPIARAVAEYLAGEN
jgi:predicted ATP-grasp superfamily ATP-dependent carboligase